MVSAKQLFSLSGISCARGGRMLFQNISACLSSGEILHLSGPNGAGKSSLLRVMAGALPVVAGDILWQGQNFLAEGMEAHAKRFSFLPADDRSLKVLETAGENLFFWGGIWGCDDAAIRRALVATGIESLCETPVRYFSAGQKRRLSLARMLLKPAPLWLLDEPLNGLDTESSALFMAALASHCAVGGMAVVASHLPLEPPAGVALRRLELTEGGV